MGIFNNWDATAIVVIKIWTAWLRDIPRPFKQEYPLTGDLGILYSILQMAGQSLIKQSF